MNEKLQYASMLEIPVNTCNITLSPIKKRKFKRKKKEDAEVVKNKLIEKVNTEIMPEQSVGYVESQEQEIQNEYEDSALEQEVYDKECQEKQVKPKNKFKLSVIGIQLTIIGVLVATIFLTNALYSDSGINVFLRGVFGTEQAKTVDERTFDEFTPVLAVGENQVSLADGIMNFSGSGSVYAPCDGTVTNVIQGDDGKYSMEITHSTNFKTLLTGIDYAYAGLEQTVYKNIPVGYVTAGATMCFMNQEGLVISDYQIVDGSVVWAV